MVLCSFSFNGSKIYRGFNPAINDPVTNRASALSLVSYLTKKSIISMVVSRRRFLSIWTPTLNDQMSIYIFYLLYFVEVYIVWSTGGKCKIQIAR